MGPGILWQLRTMDQPNGNDCLRCHAPLAEQKALMALERGWPNAPATLPPAWMPGDLHLRGLVCAACHVRRHERFGPLPRVDAPVLPAGTRRPHGGYVAQAAFSDSRFCAPCHQFPPDGRSINGKLLENTYEEWLGSRQARQGRQCQSCHMPDRRHLWRGIHDQEMVRRALHREVRVKRIDAQRIGVTVVLANRDAGHYLPTYVVPKIFVNVYVRGPGGQVLVGQHRIGRTVNVALDQEVSDTRLAPDGRHEMSFDVRVAPGEWRVKVRIEVAPGEHYERMFADMRTRNPGLDEITRRMLDEALARAVNARYFLEELEAMAPAAPGAETRSVAN
ncbi:MAG: hypothetical protein IPP91_06595 [Betaproteobacteria bacterium]|nr:hypothetical protein [Betaproteobacteria bacterium]